MQPTGGFALQTLYLGQGTTPPQTQPLRGFAFPGSPLRLGTPDLRPGLRRLCHPRSFPTPQKIDGRDGSTRRCVDASTHRRVDAQFVTIARLSRKGGVDMPSPLVNSSCVDASTQRRVKASTRGSVDASTRRHIDAWTCRCVDASTC